MEDMDLKGVELNVAVNAVIGSMVTHGYLGDLDNAILVTVSNDSIKRQRSCAPAWWRILSRHCRKKPGKGSGL